ILMYGVDGEPHLSPGARVSISPRRCTMFVRVKSVILLLAALPLSGQSGVNVLVVVNDSSLLSRRIADYYVHKRSIPSTNICHLKAPIDEESSREVYEQSIEAPIAAHLRAHNIQQTILYIVTTLGLPLRVAGTGPTEMETTTGAVDSELTLLYAK